MGAWRALHFASRPGNLSRPAQLSGVAGALVGTYGGYRRGIEVGPCKLPDIWVALVEDLLAVGGAFLIVSRF